MADFEFSKDRHESTDVMLCSFFSGEQVNQRMNLIRKSIEFIRENWANYKILAKYLLDFMNHYEVFQRLDVEIKNYVDILLKNPRNWDVYDKYTENYLTIKIYTSTTGYQELYKRCNNHFRSANLDNENEIHFFTFLVEILNIDLYHYYIKNPQLQNFQGKVYRGINLPHGPYRDFIQLQTKDIVNRYLAIPLSFWSSTLNIEIAQEYIEKNSMGDNNYPILMIINVIELKPIFVSFYHKIFPQSVITTICAIDITAESVFEREKEILLRGAFFQILEIKFEHDLWQTVKYPIMHMFMISANRDHISTMDITKTGPTARKLFTLMVKVTRFEFAIKYCVFQIWRNRQENRNLLSHDMFEYVKELKKAAIFLGLSMIVHENKQTIISEERIKPKLCCAGFGCL